MDDNNYKEWMPPGHFYSVLPSNEDVQEFYSKDREKTVPGINLNHSFQINLLKRLKQFYPPLYTTDKNENLRYYYNNGLFPHSDAIILYAMIRHLRPSRIIEIGSGFSSAVMLDTNERHFGNRIDLKFIDPYMSRLKSLASEEDLAGKVIDKRLQDIDLNVFKSLKAGDILFIDSTHVSKINSDVNKIMFEILPRLNPGVFIHLHDIFWPFIYPKDWVEKGRAWNETYILRSFLQYNDSFEIVLFGDYIHKTTDWFKNNMPLTLETTGGSIWLRKTK